MPRKRILVVEEDGATAKEIERALARLSYDVVASVASGEDALRVAAQDRPDLVLMAIVLGGEMDGIEAAQRIRDELDLPVVHMAAAGNPVTQKWASAQGPFGYVRKPIDDRELAMGIESAHYRTQMERYLLASRREVAAVLAATFDGIIVADKDGLVATINAVASELTEWMPEDAAGKDWAEIFETSEPLPSDLAQLTDEAQMRASRLVEGGGEIVFAVLLSRSGRRIPVEHRTA